jgi:hypothetical protein
MGVLEYLAGQREAVNETQFLEDPFLLVTQDNMDDPEVSKYVNSFDCAVGGASGSAAPAGSEAPAASEAPAG